MTADTEALRAPERLRALRETDLLDTPAEESFDRLTRLAARFFDAPLALVNFVDDQRQFSKSCFAPPDWLSERDAFLEDSFCKHVVIAREPLRIEDAEANPLVSSSAMVTELGIRSYLGVPLTTLQGHVLGTLCVSDFVPRTWTDEQVEMLRDLAASVMTEIEARRGLAESEQRYQLIVENIRDYGVVKLAPDGRIQAWNKGAELTTGYTHEEALGQHFSFIYRQEEIERGEPEKELAEALENGRAEREGWRVRKDGAVYWDHEVVTPIWEQNQTLRGFVKVTQDQTERRRSEEREREIIREQATRAEAEASEHRIADILESITDAFFALDGEWSFTYVNTEAQRVLQHPREELVGRSIWEVFPDAVGSAFWNEYHRAIEDRTTVSFEEYYPPLDTWFAVKAYPSSVGLTVYFRDVTERKRTESMLETMRAAMEASADGIGIVSEDGVFTYANQAQAEMYGYDSPADLIGKEWSILVSEDELHRLEADAMPVFAQEGRWRGEATGLRRDGSIFPLEVAMTRIEGIGFVCVDRDITDRKESEKALRESEERFRQLAENVREVFWLFTPDFSETLYVNPAYESVFGLPLEGLYEAPTAFMEVVHPDDAAPLLEAVRNLSVEPQSVVLRIIRPDGEERTLHARGVPIYDEQGEVYRVTGVTEDITEQKRAERRIRKAHEEAEAANRAKSEFLSRMSHELRTPLNAILGFGQLLEMDVESEENRESVDQVLKAGRHLLDLIDEVLDIARIEAGEMSLSVEPVSVRSVLQESVDLVRLAAAKQGITLRAQGALAAEQFVQADQQRLKQVLLNLMSNAIKYNRREGTVTVMCEEEGEGLLRISVCDTGYGIPTEKLERLFAPFERLGAEQTGVEGTGLGLSLSKGLVEAMGGRIGVESVEGEGSRFWVELPLAPRPEAAPPSPEGVRSEIEPGAAGLTHTVLFVEDNLANIRLIERLFQRRPHVRLLTAMQGSLGLEMAREHHPDLILLDINLPDLTGDKVLLQLRQDPALRDIPVVMISGDAIPSQVQRLLDLGATAYITKPFELQELLRVVDESLPPKED